MPNPKTVLVVDDDPDLQDFCRSVLEPAGYRVLTAGTAADGLELMRRDPADLVLLDVMMEESDSGFQLAVQLGAEYPRTPVILLSAIADASDSLFDTSVLGLADLDNKPISPARLLEKVARHLEPSGG